MENIIIEETNHRAFALTLASLFMLAASIAISVFGFRNDRPVYWLPGIAASVVFLISFIAAIAKALKVKSLLTITTDGIIDNSSINGMGFISFSDIKEFQIVNLYRSRVIAVIPKNMDSFLANLPLIKRRQVKRNIYMKLPPVSINMNLAKDMEPEDILTLLQKRLMDYSRLYD